MKKHVIGIDVGGTNIKIGIVNNQGKVIAKTHLPTASFSASRKLFLDKLVAHIDDLLKQNRLTRNDLLGVGIGLPGLIDFKNGIVKILPNISGWENVPLRKILVKALGLPVFIDNDVKVITLAESRFGAGRGVNDFVCLTLGTGVGAALVLNGQIYRGVDNAAGELGHMPLSQQGPECPCGGWGCFERYVGNRALFALAERMTGKKGVLTQDMFKLANQGDKKALAYWQEVSQLIGNGLVGLVNLLNPRLIIIGGGVANNQKYLFSGIMAVLQQRCMSVQKKTVRIKRAQLKDDAGIIGGYVLVEQNI
jgi:glucokinase